MFKYYYMNNSDNIFSGSLEIFQSQIYSLNHLYNLHYSLMNNINTNLNKYNWKSYKVQNKKMKDILKDSNFKYIDFMIIDVEGSELSLLKSINYNFPIFCIIIEAHSNEHEKNKLFGEFLTKQGFTFKERQRGNEVWINHNYFRKHKFI